MSHDLTRRQLLRRTAGLGAAALTTAALGAGGLAQRAVAGVGPRAVVLGRTSLDVVLRRGEPGESGWRELTTGPGEPHRLRKDLGGKTTKRRFKERRALLSFVQISDVHIVDAQSPLRVEWTDRYEDPNEGSVALGLFGSAYRPAEMLSAQVADSMVQQVNAIRRGPATGRRLELCIQTGDNSDNSQYNEIRWNIDVLSGGTVVPDSGDPERWEGVADSDPASYDPHYWHPEGTPEGAADDQPRRLHGFPEVPGLLDAARRPFEAVGLDIPWYCAFGNHDGLVQGNFPQYAFLDAFAQGPVKIITPPSGLTQRDVVAAFGSGDLSALLDDLVLSPGARQVTADPDRRLLSRAGVVEEHFTTTGLPVGHGFTEENRTAGTAYYAFDHGKHVRFVVMDTVNANGYADGSLDADQATWLAEQLASAGKRYVIVASHHTSGSMSNPLVGTGLDPANDSGPRVLGPAVVELLLANPCVIAWVNGHSHTNNITPHLRTTGKGGFWEINTASHIDWPQQSRTIEVTDNRDGTLSIFTTIIDHAAPLGESGTDTPLALAALSRELSANDWQEQTDGRSGDVEDRNCELLLPKPKLG